MNHKGDQVDCQNPDHADKEYENTRSKYKLNDDKMRESVARLHHGVGTPIDDVKRAWERKGEAEIPLQEADDPTPKKDHDPVTPQRLRQTNKVAYTRWNRHGEFLNLWEQRSLKSHNYQYRYENPLLEHEKQIQAHQDLKKDDK